MWGGLSNAMDVATASLTTNAGLQAIVSRNVSNAQNSTGYVSAKVAALVTGSGGAAVINSIRNLTNSSLFNAMLSSTSTNAMASALSDGITRLQKTVADAATTTDSTIAAQSPSTLLQALNSAMQTYSTSPSNTYAAAAVVTAATNLAQGLNAATATTQAVREDANTAMVNAKDAVNDLLTQFGSVNTLIIKGTATGADITDALDQRDTILQSLSKEIGISTINNSDGSMSIYTDSGVTLFQISARSVDLRPVPGYSYDALYVDGVPVTGANAVMPIQSGAIVGYAQLRDSDAVTYQAQLDTIATDLVNAFKEKDASGSLTVQGLFGYTGSPVYIAGSITVSANASPPTGSYTNLRDGVVNGVTSQNPSGAASFNTAILRYVANTGTTSASAVSATDSASWLDARYQATTNTANYQATLLTQTTQALSNVSGVNIDQQLSKMLEYENSYQASAKLISTVKTMFDTLLQAVG